MARKTDAKTIPTLAAEASPAYSVMSTVECSMMRTVLSFGGDLPFQRGTSLLVRFRTPVMLSYSPTFTSRPSKRTNSHSSKNAPITFLFHIKDLISKRSIFNIRICIIIKLNRS